jgi:hypothetical protein
MFRHVSVRCLADPTSRLLDTAQTRNISNNHKGQLFTIDFILITF